MKRMYKIVSAVFILALAVLAVGCTKEQSEQNVKDMVLKTLEMHANTEDSEPLYASYIQGFENDNMSDAEKFKADVGDKLLVVHNGNRSIYALNGAMTTAYKDQRATEEAAGDKSNYARDYAAVMLRLLEGSVKQEDEGRADFVLGESVREGDRVTCYMAFIDADAMTEEDRELLGDAGQYTLIAYVCFPGKDNESMKKPTVLYVQVYADSVSGIKFYGHRKPPYGISDSADPDAKNGIGEVWEK